MCCWHFRYCTHAIVWSFALAGIFRKCILPGPFRNRISRIEHAIGAPRLGGKVGGTTLLSTKLVALHDFILCINNVVNKRDISGGSFGELRYCELLPLIKHGLSLITKHNKECGTAGRSIPTFILWRRLCIRGTRISRAN